MFLAALRGARAFPRGLLLGGSIGVSMRQQFPEAVELGGGVSGLRVLPLDLSAHFRLSLGPGTLESGIAAGLDVLFLDDRPSSGRVSREVRLAPWVGPLVAYSLPLVRGIFARAVAGAGVHAIRYEAARGRQPDATFSTGRVHATLELEVGFAF